MSLVERPRVLLPDVGKTGDSKAPVFETFRNLGVKIDKNTISDLRNGETSGAQIARRIEAQAIVRSDNVQSKDLFFLEYGAIGITKRKILTNGKARRFGIKGLRKKIAEELDLKEDLLGSLVKAERINLFYTPEEELGASFPNDFRQAVNLFIKDASKFGFQDEINEIKRKWKRNKTVKGFYMNLLNLPSEISARWGPYEIKPLWTHALNRIKRGSHLTPFDKMVLQGVNGDTSDEAVLKKIQGDIGITIQRQVINNYRSLLMGRIKAKTQIEDGLRPGGES